MGLHVTTVNLLLLIISQYIGIERVYYFLWPNILTHGNNQCLFFQKHWKQANMQHVLTGLLNIHFTPLAVSYKLSQGEVKVS